MKRLIILIATAASAACAERLTVPLDGVWQIEDSRAPEPAPTAWSHTAPVPGLANLARPEFPGVDLFDSRELIDNRIRRKLLPESARVTTAGVPRQERNYFWYRRTFRPPQRKQVAILKINKAQFGTAVWLNGQYIGEHLPCFSAGNFELTPAMRWDRENELIVRVGAHPGVLPPSVPAGTDFEKLKWTPGIYDSVTLALSDNPTIESVQVAPRVATSEIVVQTKLANRGSAPAAFTLSHRVRAWKGTQPVASTRPRSLTLKPGDEITDVQTLKIPAARLWSPEDPFLYVVETSTGGDTASSRFGMRELRFDTATRRAYLNGRVYFLRGSNITLHRFFEDPHAGALPWDEKWVRRLLAEIPKKLNWNSFRFCIGPVPDKWFDIADEAGLLIQNEYFLWTGRNGWHREWDTKELIREYSEWVRDGWNHPSIVIWDACNETIEDSLGREIIPAVRKLDLSNRAWDNGYNLPSGPDDPIEDHPYLMGGVVGGSFRLTDLESMIAARSRPNAPHPSAHAAILNEYGWLWVNRDGSPTLLTKDIYDKLLGPEATAEQRFDLNAYLLGGLTEFWRSRRSYAGVLHFVYLTCSFPGVFTSDHFRDVEKLELEPHFADYVGEAFRPLGVCLNFWQPAIKGGAERRFAVSLINDDAEQARGRLALAIEDVSGRELGRSEARFEVPALGQHTYELSLGIPKSPGDVVVKASAQVEGRQPTVSRRRTRIE